MVDAVDEIKIVWETLEVYVLKEREPKDMRAW